MVPSGRPKAPGYFDAAYRRVVQPLVVGFDLDMTLIDPRPGLAATLLELAEARGEPQLSDPAWVDRLLRSNVDLEFEGCFGPARAPALADEFRERYATTGVSGTSCLPGAAESLAAVRAHGGRTIVVTAKFEPNAHRCLAHVGLSVDAVLGWRFGPGKADALVEHRAAIYVGDTPRDMAAAGAAGAVALGVATGPHAPDELVAAGAALVLGDLGHFPAWLAGHLGSDPTGDAT
jgi:phosphoglycolate phosphatase